MRTMKLAPLVFLTAVCLACGDDAGSDGDDSSAGGETSSADGSDGSTDSTTSDGSGDGSSGSTASGSTGSGSTAGTTTPAPFELTSPAFEEGGVIPDAHTCGGDNVSPQLDWGPGPTGTMSYAMVLNDISIDFLHSAIWDIPATTLSLPEAIEAAYMPSNVPGATQCDSWDDKIGYSGPCPPNMHTYEFTVYAVDVESLPDVDQTAGVADVVNALASHTLETASLTGTYTP